METALDRTTIYNRWLEFALNLAEVLDTTHARKERLKKEISSFITMYRPGIEGDYENYSEKPILGWDAHVEGDMCIGSHVHEYFDEYELVDKKGEFKGKFSNQLFSCIRAGLDVAVPDMNGGGVFGFSVGDVRKAYKNNVPQWLNEVLELKGDEPDNEPIWL